MCPRDLQVAGITLDYVVHSFSGVILSSPFVWNGHADRQANNVYEFAFPSVYNASDCLLLRYFAN